MKYYKQVLGNANKELELQYKEDKAKQYEMRYKNIMKTFVTHPTIRVYDIFFP